MLEITSTPLVIMAILGTVGILIPIISIARKEKGSNSFYAVIAFAALIVSMGYVGYQFINDNVAPAALFSEDVLVDDAFGGLFAIAMLMIGRRMPTVPNIAIITSGVEVISNISSISYINNIRTMNSNPAPNTNRYDCETPVCVCWTTFALHPTAFSNPSFIP